MDRAPRELLDLHRAVGNFTLEDCGSNDDDDAAPPPIQRLRTTPSRASPSNNVSKSPVAPKRPSAPTWRVAKPRPQYNDLVSVPTREPPPAPDRIPPLRLDTSPSPAPETSAPPLPGTSPRPSQCEPEPPKPSRPHDARNFSHPSKKQLQLQLQLQSQPHPQPQPQTHSRYAKTASFRNPPRPLSYRNSSRTPYCLRGRSSLDTIDSVQTTQETSRENSVDGSESTRTETQGSKRLYLSFHDDGEGGDSIAGDIPRTPPANSSPLPETSSDHSRPEFSASNSVRSISTTTQGSSSRRSTTTSPVTRLKEEETPEPLLTPERLEMQKRISLDQGLRTNSSNSTMTISSGRPLDLVFPGPSHGSTSQLSVSSKDWKSSSFDTSSLTEAEMKKCKKKGINPALYAEMKAARKGRFVSPIAGNTFI